jgi:predicted nucleic acid-binding protein
LLAALRRQRIRPGQPEEFWEQLAALPIDVEMPLSPAQAKAILALARQYGISFYDAVYLELAKRKVLPLATLDSALSSAAAAAGVALMTPAAT